MKNLKILILDICYCIKLAWKTSKLYTVIRLLGSLIAPISAILLAFILKQILDILSISSSEQKSIQLLLILMAISMLITIINKVVNKMVLYCATIHNDIIQNNISLSIFEDAMTSDLCIYDSPKYYDKFTAMRNDTFALSNIMWSTLECISALFTYISTFCILFKYNLLSAIILTIVTVPSAIANQHYTKKIYENDLAQVKRERQKNYIFFLGTTKEYAQDIRCFNISKLLKQKYNALWSKIFNSKKALSKTRSIVTGILSLIPEFVITILSFLFAIKVINKNYTIGDYSFYTGLIAQVFSSIMLLINYAMNVYDNRLKIENMKKYKNFSRHKVISGKKSILKVNCIEFCNVTFSYPDTDNIVLDDVSFKLNDKDKVAFVGTNGAGKSTIVKLLLRLYDVTSGEILINDINIKKYDIVELRQCFGVYFQNMLNFGFTLRENICLSEDSSVDVDTRVENILHLCDSTDILQKYTLNTYLTRAFSEDGVALSVGQNQKVALARAIYSKSSVVILDEPSSSLDPEAEHKIFEHLESVCDDKLTLLISHKLANVYLANRIIVIENGKIIEQGSHKELIKNAGRYAELYRYQAQRFQ